MTQQHPITPPPELVEQWEEDWHHSKVKYIEFEPYIAAQAAQWGADQELEACCEWLAAHSYLSASGRIRVNRRPKPPSLKEQALNGLEKVGNFTLDQLGGVSYFDEYKTHVDTIRRALEQLDD